MNITPQTFRNRVLIAFECSSFRGPEHPFGLDPLIGERPGGHVRYMQQRIKPFYDRGFRDFLRHLPLGEYMPSDRYMDLDSPVHLANSRQSYVIEDYHAANTYAAGEMPDALFIDYFGTHGASLQSMLDERRFDAHSLALSETISHVIDNPRVAVAFDHMANEKWTPDHPIVHWLHYVKAIKAMQGLPTIIEAWPRRRGPEWAKAWDAIAWHVFTLTRRGTGDYIEESTQTDRYEVLSGHTPPDRRPDAVTFTAECMGRTRYVPVIAYGQMKGLESLTHDGLIEAAFVRIRDTKATIDPSWLVAYPEIARKVRVIDAMKINASSARREQQGGAA